MISVTYAFTASFYYASCMLYYCSFFFFFQAEDGIRDLTVTGVQTCALPISIDGLLDELHDPYSVFLKPDDFRLLSEQTTGNYGGLDIQIDVRDGWITVVAPLPETPAERAGIQTGDQIVALDGRPTEGWKNDQAEQELRGQPGTTAELKVRRVGVDQPLVFKVTRATIHVRSVNIAMMLDDRVGYVALSPVSETSASELTEGINGLLQKGMKSLILDLRGNPGGLLDQGIAATDLFL